MANMIFQHTWEKVVSGAKTQTRRIVKWDEYKAPYGLAVPKDTIKSVCVPRSRNGVELPSHVVYEVGKQYAVMPARGVRGLRKVANIEITRIRREDVREITESDAIAEGFYGDVDFWYTWVEMHDKAYYETFKYAADVDYLNEYGFFDRPDKYYDAWALDFRVINVYADAIEIARQLLTEAA